MSPQSGSIVHQSYDSIDGLGKQVAPAVPASTVGLVNPFTFACLVRITGGTTTVITVGGVQQQGVSPQLVYVDVGETIAITYSVVPAWSWFGVPGK